MMSSTLSCLLLPLFALVLCLKCSAPCLFGSRHAGWQMISRTILALLGLDGLVVHMHVVLDRGHVLMPKQFLQTEGVVAQDQITNGKGMAKDVRTDALVGDASPFAQTSEEQGDAILA